MLPGRVRRTSGACRPSPSRFLAFADASAARARFYRTASLWQRCSWDYSAATTMQLRGPADALVQPVLPAFLPGEVGRCKFARGMGLKNQQDDHWLTLRGAPQGLGGGHSLARTLSGSYTTTVP